MKKLCVSILLVSALSSGCARTVTSIGQVGSQITVQVTFKEDIQSENRLFILFGARNQAPVVPFIPFELVPPGEAVTDTQINYFTDFYSSWTDYALVQGQVAQLIRGPFTSGGTPEALQLSEFTRPTNSTFSLTYALNRMSFGATTPEFLYIDIVSVGRDNKVADNLSFNLPAGTLSTLQMRTDQGTSLSYSDLDAAGAVINGSLDIQNYTISVQ